MPEVKLTVKQATMDKLNAMVADTKAKALAQVKDDDPNKQKAIDTINALTVKDYFKQVLKQNYLQWKAQKNAEVMREELNQKTQDENDSLDL